MADIVLNSLEKSFDNIKIIKNLNLKVKDGEFLVLVGPSGCGKSTTLRLIAGLEEVNGGNIFIGGKDVTDVPPKNRDIAMVFQNYALYPHMTVFENISFGLKIRKMPKEKINKLVNETADILDIKEVLDRKPKQLSGGQKQRVALGRAIVRKPSVFLFDEPLSNLDAKLRVQMRSEIKRLHNRLKTTMVYVTHDQVEAMTMGDRIVIMKDGIIHQIDTPQNIYSNPADVFVAEFIGTPSINLINLKLENKTLKSDNGEITFDLTEEINRKLDSYDDNEFIAGIRPEHIKIKSSPESFKIDSNIEMVENMGNEMVLYTENNQMKLTCRTHSENNYKINDKISLYLDLSNLLFFDKKSSKRLIF